MSDLDATVAVPPPGTAPWRRRVRRGTGAAAWLAAVPLALFAVLRLAGYTGTWYLVVLLAFTPYLAAAAVPALALAALSRRWVAAAVAGLAALALAWCVLPRAAGAAQPRAGGSVLRVLSANLRVGGADAATLVALLRAQRADLLAVQEFTPYAQDALSAAGLDDLLPYHVRYGATGVGGSALYARYPLTAAGYRSLPGDFGQAYATLSVPGAPAVLVESVHPCAPSEPSQLDCWHAGLAAEPPATVDGPLRILAGDFNATLDHEPLRRLLGTGYRDAATACGAGLVPSWPYDGRPVPGVVLDHILTDPRIAVRRWRVLANPGSDHRAVLAELVLPRA